MDINKAFKIIEKNIDSADFCGPISEDKVVIAEELLGIKFPDSYSMFIKEYGAGDIAGIELLGIVSDPASDRPMIPNGIWLTQRLRKEEKLPNEFLVVYETGYGPYYLLDTSQLNKDSECPVYLWDGSNQKKKLFDSYGEFLLKLLEESV